MLDAVELERLQQQRELHRPLALLDQVRYAGGDPEVARDVGLLEAALEAQLAQPPPHRLVRVAHRDWDDTVPTDPQANSVEASAPRTLASDATMSAVRRFVAAC